MIYGDIYGDYGKRVHNREAPLLKAIIWSFYAITGKQRETESHFVLPANRKSHTGFRLVSKSVTLNDLERRNYHWRALSLRQLSFLFYFHWKLTAVDWCHRRTRWSFACESPATSETASEYYPVRAYIHWIIDNKRRVASGEMAYWWRAVRGTSGSVSNIEHVASVRQWHTKDTLAILT